MAHNLSRTQLVNVDWAVCLYRESEVNPNGGPLARTRGAKARVCRFVQMYTRILVSQVGGVEFQVFKAKAV